MKKTLALVCTEKELAAKAVSGDSDAFWTLVNSNRDACIFAARKVVRGSEDAEDLVTEAFLRAKDALGSFNTNRPFLPWLLKIVRNHCINYIASSYKQKNDSLESMEEDSAPLGITNTTPRLAAQSEETKAMVWEAINALSPKFKEIIVMNHINEMSYKEISQSLNIPIGTIMSRLFNARKALKLSLTELIEKE